MNFSIGFRVHQLLSGDYSRNFTNGVTRGQKCHMLAYGQKSIVHIDRRFKVHQILPSQVILGQAMSCLFIIFFRLHVLIYLRVFFIAWHDLFQPSSKYIYTLHKYILPFVWLVLAVYVHTVKFKFIRLYWVSKNLLISKNKLMPTTHKSAFKIVHVSMCCFERIFFLFRVISKVMYNIKWW